MSKDTKKKISLDIMKSKRWKVEKWRKEKKKCKDMKDYSMVENENEDEEMGQLFSLAQVFLRAPLVFYMLCMSYISFLL